MKTKLYMWEGMSRFMMLFVVETENDNVIID